MPARPPSRGSEFHELDTDPDDFTPATTAEKLGTTLVEPPSA